MRIGRLLAYVAGTLCLGAGVFFVATSEDSAVVAPVAEADPVGVARSLCPPGTGGRVSCMLIEVPEDYADPEIKQIEVFAARIPPPFEPAGPPIVYIGREIGEPAVQDLTSWQKLSREIEREIILVDLRGVGSSVPRLACADAFRDEWLQAEMGAGEVDDLLVASRLDVETCRDRLQREVALEAYTLEAFAKDLDVVRERLQIEEWTVMAGGRASTVARRLEQLFPDDVESLVLLGAAPSSQNDQVERYEYAVEALAEALGPETLAQLETTASRLSSQSIVFPVQVRNRTQRVLVSDETIAPTIVRTLDDPEFRDGLSRFVTERLGAGEWRSIALLRGTQRSVVLSRSTAAVMATVCAESAPGDSWLDDPAFDSAWTGLLDDIVFDPGACGVWVGPAPTGLIPAPTSRTLALNGRYDLAAPTSAADEIGRTWDQATVMMLDTARPSPLDECVIDVLKDFLAGSEPTLGPLC